MDAIVFFDDVRVPLGNGSSCQLFHLAWDLACSAFGSRQVLYERFFQGDATRNAALLCNTYDLAPDLAPSMEQVRALPGEVRGGWLLTCGLRLRYHRLARQREGSLLLSR